MKPKPVITLLTGVALLALYKLLLVGSGVGVRERWTRLKGQSER